MNILNILGWLINGNPSDDQLDIVFNDRNYRMYKKYPLILYVNLGKPFPNKDIKYIKRTLEIPDDTSSSFVIEGEDIPMISAEVKEEVIDNRTQFISINLNKYRYEIEVEKEVDDDSPYWSDWLFPIFLGRKRKFRVKDTFYDEENILKEINKLLNQIEKFQLSRDVKSFDVPIEHKF